MRKGSSQELAQVVSAPSIHLELLGFRVKDRVTGFEGVVSSVCFDLYGCIQAVVNPGLDKDGKPRDSHYFDIGRLEATSDDPVMQAPDFENINVAAGQKGPAEKPACGV